MPRRRLLCLGGPKTGFLHFMVRLSVGGLGEPLRLGVVKLRLGVPASSVFSSFLSLSLTIVHWINEDPNK